MLTSGVFFRCSVDKIGLCYLSTPRNKAPYPSCEIKLKHLSERIIAGDTNVLRKLDLICQSGVLDILLQEYALTLPTNVRSRK